MTNLGGFSILAYLIISKSGSIFAQAYLKDSLLGPKITIDLPIAEIGPSKGRFESVTTFRLSPMSIVPKRADKSPT